MKRNLIVFTAGAVTSLFISDVIKRLEIKTSSNTIKRNPYLKFIEYGLPSIDNLEYYQQFVTSIDYARRIPHWVGYSLSRDCLSRCSFEPTSTRTRSEFNSDCQVVPKQFRATNQDYFGSGWSRGHMAPAGDHKYGSQQAMDQTFILSANIVPQDLDNNGNYWCRMEWFARELARKYDFVHIITGPLFIPKDQKQKVNIYKLFQKKDLIICVFKCSMLMQIQIFSVKKCHIRSLVIMKFMFQLIFSNVF